MNAPTRLDPHHLDRLHEDGLELRLILETLLASCGRRPAGPDPVVADIICWIAPKLAGIETLTVDDDPRLTFVTAPSSAFHHAYLREQILDLRYEGRKRDRVVLIVPPRVLLRRFAKTYPDHASARLRRAFLADRLIAGLQRVPVPGSIAAPGQERRP